VSRQATTILPNDRCPRLPHPARGVPSAAVRGPAGASRTGRRPEQ